MPSGSDAILPQSGVEWRVVFRFHHDRRQDRLPLTKPCTNYEIFRGGAHGVPMCVQSPRANTKFRKKNRTANQEPNREREVDLYDVTFFETRLYRKWSEFCKQKKGG